MLDMNVDRTINAIGMLLIGAVILVVGFDLFGRDSSFLLQIVGGSEGYVVEYELNGGDGEFNRSVIDYEETHFTIVDREPTRSSYVFTGWEVEGEAGEVYFPGSILPIDDNIKLVAQWREGTHNVKYDLNGGTGNLPDDRAKFNVLYQIKTTVPTKTGYHLTGWKSSSDSGEYASGHKLYITEATTLTAQWKINEYAIQYDLNGGTGTADYPLTNVQHGRNFTISNVTPKRNGYVFNGWLSESSGQKYGVGDNFTANASTRLVAQWAVENKRINFDLNGGSYSGVNNPPALTQYAGFDELFTTPDQLPVKAGYVFNGWINNHDNLTYQAGTTFRVKNDTRLTAQWSLDKYAVTYDLDGGSGSFAGITVNHNTEYTVRTGTPVKGGYTFNGWISSLDNNLYRGNEKFRVYNNTVLKADWKINNYTVDFDLNGGSGTFNPDTVNFNDKYAISTRTPVKDGDAFVGWRNSADNRIYKAGDEFVIAGPTTLTAQWSTNSYTVSYNTNGGSGNFSNTTHLYGANVTVNKTKPTRTGYTFLSWLNKLDGKHYGSGARFPLRGDTELEAQWDLNTYHINYNLNGGSGSFPREEVDHGVVHRIHADVPTRTGYTFKGWKLGNETTLREPASAVTPTGNITLTAQWEMESHSVTYNLDGGTGVTHFTTTHARNHGVKHTIATQKPTKKGHNFIRWNNSLDGKTYNPGGSFTVTDDVILTAEWETGIFDITFNLGGGTVIDNSGFAKKQIPYDGDFMIDSQVPHKSGVEFIGWLDTNTRNLYQPGEMFIVEESTHFEAFWGHNEYFLKYDANGGSITYKDTVIPSGENDGIGWAEIIDGEQHTVIAGPTLKDYRFEGWEDISSGKVYQPGAKISVRTDTTLRAKYALNKYTVSFNLNSGSGSFPSQEVVTNASHKLSSTKPTRTGYTFAGWKRSDNGAIVQAGGSFTMPNRNITLTATWTANTYKISYSPNGGAGSFPTTSHKFGSSATVSGVQPNRIGHKFNGWKRSDTGAIVQPGAKITMPANNITLTGQWTINKHTISYNLNGGSGSFATQTFNFDDYVRIHTATPTRTGYNFTGWKRSDTGAVISAGSRFTISRNVTLTAQWKLKTYTITFNRNGGSGGPTSQSKSHGVNVNLSTSKPTRSGYRFDGWTTNSNGTGTRYNAGGLYTGNANRTLYAKWVEQQPYRIYLDRVKSSGNTTSSAYGFGGSSFSLTPGQQFAFETLGYIDQRAANDGKLLRTYLYESSWAHTSAINYHTRVGSGIYRSVIFTVPSNSSGSYRTQGYLYPSGGSRAGKATWQQSNLFLMNPTGPRNETKANGEVLVDVGTTIRLPQPGYSKPGYSFGGWTRGTDGKVFKAGDNVAIQKYSGGRVQFNAIWNATTYRVTYNKNGGTGGPGNTTAKHSASFKVSSSKPTRAGYNFNGWTISTGGTVGSGGSFTMPRQNVTLTARWTPRTYTITFNRNSGSGGPSSQTKTHGTTLKLTTSKPTRTWYNFASWNTNSAGTGTNYNSGANYTGNSNATLYARWTRKTYTVKSGDNLTNIAKRYNTTWQTLYNNNRHIMNNPDRLTLGWKLYVP